MSKSRFPPLIKETLLKLPKYSVSEEQHRPFVVISSGQWRRQAGNKRSQWTGESWPIGEEKEARMMKEEEEEEEEENEKPAEL